MNAQAEQQRSVAVIDVPFAAIAGARPISAGTIPMAPSTSTVFDLKDVVPGPYDVKLADKKGRVCVVQNVEVLAGRPYAFSISEKDLTDCRE
jgi:hypothetical protein